MVQNMEGTEVVEEGYVSRIIFRNEGNGYTVFVLEQKKDDIVCTGLFNAIEVGEFLKLTGHMEDNFRGPQFKVSSYEICVPRDTEAMERYLASGVIKGIGASLSSKIVGMFGEDTFRVIEEEPELLARIKGISEKKAQDIGVQFNEKHENRQATIFMQKLGISNSNAIKIYKKYGKRIYQILKENPYRLADEMNGIGFRTADEIAAKAGIPVDSDYRIKSAVIYILNQGLSMGHVCLPVSYIKEELSELLRIETENLEEYFADLSMERKIKIKSDGNKERMVYLLKLYFMELNCARMLLDLNLDFKIVKSDVENQIKKCSKNMDFELDKRQSEAVTEAVGHGFFVLTGGPGTGKTTTINAMIAYFDSQGMEILLAAPTGRAARKMKETTGWEAQTVHRLLGVSPGHGDEDGEAYMRFEKDEQNPLEADVVIIDEVSMVDIFLLHALLRAIAPGTRLIFVGDVNQLPSVGPGNVLRDIMNSESFHVAHLEKIFRQAAKSDIVLNAHRINRGEYPVLDNESKDFFMLERETADEIIGVIIYLISKKLPAYVKAETKEIQVLTPTRKGLLGVERMNPILQQYLNPPAADKEEKKYGDKLFRVGDKVMQIKNNYQLAWEIRDDYGGKRLEGSGIYNGDIGTIMEISEYLDVLVVEFEDSKRVTYHGADLDELELAYAITIHKSQGSEYPAVLIPLLPGSAMLFTRNLLYTAVTRAKKCVTIVGKSEVVRRMVENNQERTRYSTMKKRILEMREE